MKTFKEYQLYLEQNERFEYKLLEIWINSDTKRVAIKSEYIDSFQPTLKGLRAATYAEYNFIADGIIAAQFYSDTIACIIVSKDSEHYDDLEVHSISYYQLPAKMQLIISNLLSKGVDAMNAIYVQKKTISYDDEVEGMGDIFD